MARDVIPCKKYVYERKNFEFTLAELSLTRFCCSADSGEERTRRDMDGHGNEAS
jgi:hypothetical protein